jgi:hypothetical protein
MIWPLWLLGMVLLQCRPPQNAAPDASRQLYDTLSPADSTQHAVRLVNRQSAPTAGIRRDHVVVSYAMA